MPKTTETNYMLIKSLKYDFSVKREFNNTKQNKNRKNIQSGVQQVI